MKLVRYAALLLVLVTGCQACSNCSDYTPPVTNGPYSHLAGRAGSALSGEYAPPLYSASKSVSDATELPVVK
jgi:hypothetical protein